MKKNIRRKLAERGYLDPNSDTFLNKSASLQKAGYSKSYAEAKGIKILDNTQITEEDLANFQSIVHGLPVLVELTNRKMEQLAESNSISAKDYATILRHIELIAKFAGVLKERMEIRKEVRIVKIQVPEVTAICPDCGNEFETDIIREEYKRIEQPK